MLTKLPPARMNLLAAADLIEERGLAKYTRVDSCGALCIHGAINKVEVGDPWGHNVGTPFTHYELVYNYLRATYPNDDRILPMGLGVWNNAPERTKEEVVSALRNAAVYGL